MTPRHPNPTRRPTHARRRLRASLDALEHRRLLAAFTVDPNAPIEGSNHATIGSAVTAAAANTDDPFDTVDVVAGAYAEDVVIGSPVVLRGAKFGVDPRLGRGVGESVVTGQIAIESAGVTVDGFTILSGAAGASAPTVSGAYVNAAGATVSNNILTGAAGAGTGVLASATTSGATLVTRNAITGWSIGIDVRAAGTVTLSDNAIANNAAAGVSLELLGAAAASAVSISGSTLDNPNAPQVLLNGGTEAEDGVTFAGNAVTLRGTATFVSRAAPTPASGLSANTFTLIRATSEDVPLTVNLDVDGTGFGTYDLSTLAGSASADGDVITYVPAPNFNGPTSFNFTTMGDGTTTATGTVLIAVTPVNDAPTSTAIPAQSVLAGQAGTLALATFVADVDVNDAVPDVLTYFLTGAPAFVTVVPETGVVTISPTAGDFGTYAFSAGATDGDASTTRSISLTVVRAANGAPAFGNLPASVTLAENALAPVLTVAATDPEGDGIVYSIFAGNEADRFAIDALTGVVTMVAPLDAEQATSYALVIRATDDGDPAPASADATLTVNVTDENEAAGSVSVSGPAAGFEGQALTFLATASDPDVGATFSYRWFVDDVEQVGQTAAEFTVSFAAEGQHQVRVEARDRAGAAVADEATVAVADAAPTIPLSTSASAVDEASALVLTVGTITDSGAGDVGSIGQLVVEWGDGTFTIINDGTDAARLADVRAGVPISLSHTYSDGSNTDRAIVVRVWDDAGRTFSAGTTVLVRNVAPTGSFVAVTPTVSSGSSAIVNWFGQTDASPEDRAAGLRYTYAIDADGDGQYDAGETLIAGDASYAGSVSTSQLTIARTFINAPGSYSILGLLFDKDGSPFLTRQATVTVTPGPFRVISLGGDHSGFTVTFNQVVDRAPLNLFDGTDVAADTPDLTVTRANGQALRGSIIWNVSGTSFDFIVSGGIIAAGTYTVTLRSGNNAFQDIAGTDLDGDGNGTAGGTFVSVFGVNAPPGPVLSMADFSRGPGQTVDVIPGNANSDLPVTVNSPIAITSLNFQIRYDASLLTVRPADPGNGIVDVYAGAGLPAGWSVDYTISAGAINVSLIKTTPTTPDIAAGFRELIKIRATVPNDSSIYGRSQYLSFATIVVNGSASIEGTADRSVHNVAFLGDANLDGNVNAADAALMQSVVLGSVTGFDSFGVIDPAIVADSSRNFVVDAQDATNAALSGFTGGRPSDVPAFTPITLPRPAGATATFRVGTIYALPGQAIAVPIDVTDDARGVQAGVIRIAYDAAVLDLAEVPALAGSLMASGWTMLTNANEAEGYVEIAFFSGTALAGSGAVTGTLATLQFSVLPGIADVESPLTIAPPTDEADSPTVFYDRQGVRRATAAVSGAVIIDRVAPTTAEPATFDYAGSTQTVDVTFSEDVGASLAAGDFELVNLTTGAVVGVAVAAVSADGRTVTLSFLNTGGVTNAILVDGDYRLRVRAGQVEDGAGNALAADADSAFFFVNGDADHDRAVSFSDLLIVAQNYSTAGGATFARGDFNYDGSVNFSDLLILAQRYNTSLALPRAATVTTGVAGAAKRSQTRRSDGFGVIG